MLEQTHVVPRRSQEHRHLVERHAGGGFVQDAPDDLDRLPALTRGGEQPDIAQAFALGRRRAAENEAAKAAKIGRRIGDVANNVDDGAHRFERRDRESIALGNGDERVWRALEQRARKRPFGAGVERHVEQHYRQRGPPNAAGPARVGCDPEECGPIVHAGGGTLIFNAGEQDAQIAVQTIARDASQSQLVERTRQGFGEPGKRGDWSKVVELAGGEGVEHGACGNRLCPGLRAGQSSAGCGGGRGARGELGQTEPDEAERGTDFARNASCEVVGRAARRAHDDDLGSGKMTAKKIARDLEAGGSRSGSNDLHVTLLPDAMPETRKTAAPRCRDSDYTTRT